MKPKERYTKISHEDVERHVFEEKHEEVVVVDHADEWKNQNRWNIRTLYLKYMIPISHAFIFFLATVFMIYLLATIPTDNMVPTVGVIEDLSYISTSNPILDIVPTGGSQVCQNPNYEPMQFSPWLGTGPGCYCNKNQLTYGYCGYPTSSGCVNITAGFSMDTYTWNADRFCALRLTDFIRTVDSCPNGYKKCGNFICVPSSGPCPITNAEIIPSSSATPAGYTMKPMTNNLNLVFINSLTASSQFVQFTYSTSSPCLDMYQYDWRTNKLKYPLENENMNGCGDYGYDLESVSLVSMSESNYFLYNWLNTWTQNLPNFEQVQVGSTVALSARYRFNTELTDQCASVYIEDVNDLLQDIYDFTAMYTGIVVTATIMSFFAAFVGIVYIKVFKRDGTWITDKEEPFGRRFIVYISLVSTIFCCIASYLGLNQQNKFSSRKTAIESLASANCFTPQANINLALHRLTVYMKGRTDYFVDLTLLLAIVGLGCDVLILFNLVIRRLKNWEKKF